MAQFFETVVENRFRYDNRISRTKAPMDKPTYTPPEPEAYRLDYPVEFSLGMPRFFGGGDNPRRDRYAEMYAGTVSVPLFTHDQLIQAHAAGLAQGRSEAVAEVKPVEVWRGDRKVTIYPGENVMCMDERVARGEFVSDVPYTLPAVQEALDWLYED